MFYFICKSSFLHGRQTMGASQSYRLLYNLRDSPSIFKLSSSIRFFSTTSNSNSQSFTVSYLISKFGFSPELASWASTYVHFETPEKPDSLIAFLEKHGFSKTQIRNLIKRQPKLLVSDTEKTLLPKIEFLYSVGFSRPDLAKLLSNYPTLLRSSLEKQIIPSFNFLRNLFQSDDKTIKAIKRFTGILVYDFESYLFPNMNILRGNGVPESNIVTLLNRKPRTFMFNPVRLKEIVEEVKRMGIDSSTMKFLDMAFALKSMSQATLEKKFDVYRRWGCSDEEIRQAFQKHPSCMTVSEDKITAIMDFLVNKMGFSSTLVAKQSSIFSRSLEKRIVPRALFAQELLSKGLINGFKLSVLFDTSEKVFLRIFPASVEDLQWSPTEPHAFVSCSVDGTIAIWDIRLGKSPAASFKAHDADVNVISWNRQASCMLASGSDDGTFSIHDFRLLKDGNTVVAHFKYHKYPVTSIEWSPHEASTLAVSSSDNQLTIWDLSLEKDNEEEAEFKAQTNELVNAPEDLPPQLLFVHQGQKDLKELHWHAQIPGMIVSTAGDGFNILMPSNIQSTLPSNGS